MIPSAQEDHAMLNALSADIRLRFETLYREGLSGREAGRRLMISAASASRLAQRIKRGTGLEPAVNPRKTGKGKLAPYSDFFVELIKQDPDITLAELKSALEHAHGVCASISGVDLALRRLGYSYKKRALLRTSAGAPA